MPTEEEEAILEAVIAAGFPPGLASRFMHLVRATPVEEQRELLAEIKRDPAAVKAKLTDALGGGYYTYPARIISRNADGTFDVVADAKADPNGDMFQVNHRAIAEVLGLVDGMQFSNVRHDPRWGEITNDAQVATLNFEGLSLEKPTLWKATVAIPLTIAKEPSNPPRRS